MKMDKVKFRKLVLPGDTLILKMEKITPFRRGVVTMRGTAFVGSSLVAEGEFMAQISKIKTV
jgi:UDP-3-O-[3-hydroxymyristoyl] N-acetylglucosamine deacetylase/3-hydroxyacyl-[acyl-carrier-protein] dehydratase